MPYIILGIVIVILLIKIVSLLCSIKRILSVGLIVGIICAIVYFVSMH